MRAGPLRSRVRLERCTVARAGELKEKVETWTTIATVAAEKIRSTGAERQRAGETGAVIETRWRIRWSDRVADLTPKDRLVYAGRVFNIVEVDEIELREEIIIRSMARADLAPVP